MKVCHSGSLKCAMCTYTFKTNEELEKHIDDGHSDIEKETFKANTQVNESQIADHLIEDNVTVDDQKENDTESSLDKQDQETWLMPHTRY